DDNAWIGIAMVDAYKQNPKNPEYLDRAKKLFDYVSSAAEGTENLPHPGGLFWQQGEDVRTAVSTAGGTQLALELYQQTHDEKYLDFAKKQYNWMNDTLKNKDGLFLDGINANGSNDNHETLFSYNQGLMLGNATMLYQITGDKNYLDQANQIAKGTIDWRFNEQEPFFNAVYFKNLMLLDSVQPNNEYRQALSKYAGDLQNTLNGGNIDKWHDHELTQAAARQIFALAEQNPPT
ncbi:MAG: glycoside hydrolase family 76 protein, partial [Candidatus Obscuribacterales bacterium]